MSSIGRIVAPIPATLVTLRKLRVVSLKFVRRAADQDLSFVNV
jgi:hypothetical protein